jgi:hypothetical protein
LKLFRRGPRYPSHGERVKGFVTPVIIPGEQGHAMFLDSESGGDDAGNDVTSTNPTGGRLGRTLQTAGRAVSRLASPACSSI